MRLPRLALFGLLASSLLRSTPAASGAPAAEPLAGQALAALKKATAFLQSISTHGGYAGIYSLDLKQRYGESLKQPAEPNEIWIQPPGTPSVGQACLRAYRATGDSQFLQAARGAAVAVAWGQRDHGGWDHLVDLSHFDPNSPKPQQKPGKGTLDDNISQGAVDFLMDLDQTIDEPWLTEAVDRGLNYVLKSQFPNGAWPQWFPLIGGYHDYYTFNDEAINDCIRVMLEAHRLYGREECLRSAKRGGDFILLSQVPAPQSGWAQQYSHDMKPSWARTFEPAAVCSACASANIRTLVDLFQYTGERKFLEPIPAAIDWLERSKIGPDKWARLYELGTNKPIYGDRDGKVHYTLEEISRERRSSYSWRGDYKIPATIARYREAAEAKPSAPEKPASPGKPEALAPAVQDALGALDAQGRWLKNDMIQTKAFVRSANLLCDYLERTKGPQP